MTEFEQALQRMADILSRGPTPIQELAFERARNVELSSELSALKEEVERLRKDAERYRWLRREIGLGQIKEVSRDGHQNDDHYAVQVDRAIDSLSGGDE